MALRSPSEVLELVRAKEARMFEGGGTSQGVAVLRWCHGMAYATFCADERWETLLVGSVLVPASWLDVCGGESIDASVGGSRFIWIRKFVKANINKDGRRAQSIHSLNAPHTWACGVGKVVVGGVEGRGTSVIYIFVLENTYPILLRYIANRKASIGVLSCARFTLGLPSGKADQLA